MSICTLTSITLLVYNKTNAKTSLHFTLDLCFPLPSLFNIKKPPYIYTYMMTPLIKYTEKETILLSEEQICNCSVVPLAPRIARFSANRPKSLTELTCKFFCKKNVWFLFRYLITHLLCFFLTKLRFRLSINQSSDQFYRFINTIAGTVDTQIIVDSISPVLSGIGMIIILMLMIHLTNQINCLLQIQVLQFHHTTHTDCKRCSDVNTNVRNLLPGQYNICCSSTYNHIFLLCQLTNQCALAEERSIFL